MPIMPERTPRSTFPGLLPTLAAACAAALCAGLGVWQLQRADYKDRMREEYLQRIHMPTLQLGAQESPLPEAIHGRRGRILGQPAMAALLLDNRVQRGKAGYDVFVPYRLAGGGADAVLVHTAWVPAPARRSEPPALPRQPAGVQTGIFLRPPRTGWARPGREELAPRLYRVQRLQPAELSGLLGMTLLPFVLTLDPDGAWMRGGGGTRSRGYAVQWFALGLTVLVIYAVLAYRRRP